MKSRILFYISLAVITAGFWGCDEDDENFASIVGQWNGDKAEFRVNFIPFTEDEFDVNLEFRNDGVVRYEDDDETISGSYTVDGKTLTITGVNVNDFPVSISGIYEIKLLTDTQLEIEGEREGQITNTTYGTISGNAKANLFFTKTGQ